MGNIGKLKTAFAHFRKNNFTVLNKSELYKENMDLKEKIDRYSAFKDKFVVELIRELESCSSLIIECKKGFDEDFERLLNDSSFSTMFDITEEDDGKYRISYSKLSFNEV